MPSRLWRAAAILAPSLLLASLGAAVSANAATTNAPSLVTVNYVCSNGVCEVGPGNVGVAFATALGGTGGPFPSLPDCAYTMSVVSGSLPPGLQLGGLCNNIISGTPQQAGTYPFTAQVQSQPNSLGQPGPTGTQQLTITIGTGSSDRMANLSAVFNGHTDTLSVSAYDVNAGARYSVSVTATGTQLFAPALAADGTGRFGFTTGPYSHWPCPGERTCSLTVSDSLGSSVQVTLPPVKY